MHFILEKISHYGFNRRFMTERDFFYICEVENIEVQWTDSTFSWYMTVDGQDYIILPKKERGLSLLFKMFHELGHFFGHAGEEANQIFFHGLTDSRDEFEADTIATIALVPKFALKSYEFLEEHPVKLARQLFEDRQKIEFLHNI